MPKAEVTKSGRVRITLSVDEAGKLWAILACSHTLSGHHARQARVGECEEVSFGICAALAKAGLEYSTISPEGKARYEDISS